MKGMVLLLFAALAMLAVAGCVSTPNQTVQPTTVPTAVAATPSPFATPEPTAIPLTGETATPQETVMPTETTASTVEPTATPVSSPAPNVKEFAVTVKQFEFVPSTITVTEGDTVKLAITSADVAHGFALPDFGVSETIEPGKTTAVEFVASKKGTFSFFCNVPCGSGHGSMRGQLVVN